MSHHHSEQNEESIGIDREVGTTTGCRMALVRIDPRSYLSTHPGLLQEVLLNAGPFDGPRLVEVDVDVLPKAAGVVVADGFGITEGWEGTKQGVSKG